MTTRDFDEWQAYYQSFDISVPHYAMANGSGTDDQLSATPIGAQVVRAGAQIVDVGVNNRVGIGAKTKVTMVSEYLPGNFEISLEAYVFGKRILDIDLVHNRDVIQNLPNYDILAGSVSNVGLAELSGATDIHWAWGFIAPEFVWKIAGAGFSVPGKYFSYVPTQSALNAPIEFSPSLSATGFDMDEGVLSNREPVDLPQSYRGPTTSFNHEHVSFTPQLVTFFLDKVIDGLSEDGDLVAPPWEYLGRNYVLREPFNFGRSFDPTDQAYTPGFVRGRFRVEGGGRLYVNRNGLLGLSSLATTNNADQQHFDLDVGRTPCGSVPTDIEFGSGARLRIGDGFNRTATVTVDEEARIRMEDGSIGTVHHGSELLVQSFGPDGQGGLIVESGSLLIAEERAGASGTPATITIDGGVLRIKAGGELRIHRHGRVQVLNGGRVIIEDGGEVVFTDPDNPYESEGVLYVGGGGKLEVQGRHVWAGPGYLHFDTPEPTAGGGALVLRAGDPSRRRLFTSQLVALAPGQDFNVRGAKVLSLWGGIRVRDGGEITAQDALFEGGLKSLSTDGTGRAYVRSCIFSNSDQAFELDASQVATSASTRIQDCTFDWVYTAVALRGPGRNVTSMLPPLVTNCDFVECIVGVELTNIAAATLNRPNFEGFFDRGIAAENFGHVEVTQGTLNGDAAATHTVWASHGDMITLNGGQYTGVQTGVDIEDVSLVLTNCVEIGGHGEAAIEAPNAEIVLAGATIKDSNYGIRGTDVTVTRRTNTYGDVIRNTLGRKSGPGLPNLFSRLTHTGGSYSDPIAQEDYTHNRWEENGQTATPHPDWFCSYRFNAWCTRGALIDNVTDGCGTECDNSTCPGFCDDYPEDCDPGSDWPGDPDFPFEPAFVNRTSSPTLHPNPARNSVTVSGLRDGVVTARLLTPSGYEALNLRRASTDAQWSIDISHLPTGSYTLEALEETAGAKSRSAEPRITHFPLAIIR